MDLRHGFFFRPRVMIRFRLHDGNIAWGERRGLRPVELVADPHVQRSGEHRDVLDVVMPMSGKTIVRRKLDAHGDMLLEANRPAEALKAFEASALREPNRLRGVHGTAKAAALTGDREKARMYYAKLVALTEKADDASRETQEAREYLARR